MIDQLFKLTKLDKKNVRLVVGGVAVAGAVGATYYYLNKSDPTQIERVETVAVADQKLAREEDVESKIEMKLDASSCPVDFDKNSKDEGLRSRLMLHRGFHVRGSGNNERPLENTMPAYIQASELGYILAECDVALSKDGKILLIHNDNLESLAADPSSKLATTKISDLTWEQISSIPLNDGGDNSTRCVLLETVLNFCASTNMRMMVELKRSGGMPLVEKLTDFFAVNAHFLQHVFCFASFDGPMLAKLKQKMRSIANKLPLFLGLYFTSPWTGFPLEKVFNITCDNWMTHLIEQKRKYDWDGFYLQYQDEFADFPERVKEITKNFFVAVWCPGNYPLEKDTVSQAKHLFDLGVKIVNTDLPDHFFAPKERLNVDILNERKELTECEEAFQQYLDTHTLSEQSDIQVMSAPDDIRDYFGKCLVIQTQPSETQTPIASLNSGVFGTVSAAYVQAASASNDMIKIEATPADVQVSRAPNDIRDYFGKCLIIQKHMEGQTPIASLNSGVFGNVSAAYVQAASAPNDTIEKMPTPVDVSVASAPDDIRAYFGKCLVIQKQPGAQTPIASLNSGVFGTVSAAYVQAASASSDIREKEPAPADVEVSSAPDDIRAYFGKCLVIQKQPEAQTPIASLNSGVFGTVSADYVNACITAEEEELRSAGPELSNDNSVKVVMSAETSLDDFHEKDVQVSTAPDDIRDYFGRCLVIQKQLEVQTPVASLNSGVFGTVSAAYVQAASTSNHIIENEPSPADVKVASPPDDIRAYFGKCLVIQKEPEGQSPIASLNSGVFGTVSAAYVQAANAPNDIIRNEPVLEEKKAAKIEIETKAEAISDEPEHTKSEIPKENDVIEEEVAAKRLDEPVIEKPKEQTAAASSGSKKKKKKKKKKGESSATTSEGGLQKQSTQKGGKKKRKKKKKKSKMAGAETGV